MIFLGTTQPFGLWLGMLKPIFPFFRCKPLFLASPSHFSKRSRVLQNSCLIHLSEQPRSFWRGEEGFPPDLSLRKSFLLSGVQPGVLLFPMAVVLWARRLLCRLVQITAWRIFFLPLRTLS